MVLDSKQAARNAADALILRESIQEFPGPVAVYDHDDNLIACNELYKWVHGAAFDTVRERSGNSPIRYEDLVRESAKSVVDADDLEAHIADRVKAQRDATGQPTDRFYPNRGWFRIIKVRTPSGAVVGFATNITELKEKTAELEQARAAADAANTAKSAFLANMSHELRTPLNAIIGLSEALISGVFGPIENEKHREYITDIQDSGNHLLALISDLLDLAKVEAGTLDLYDEEFAVADLISDCVNMMLPIAVKASIGLTTQMSGIPCSICADYRKLKQAVLNILANAIKYSPTGTDVQIVTKVDHDSILIRVQDQGIGIDLDDVGRVFEPFGRLAATQRDAPDGAGLGLPIAKRLVELHGGAISIDSARGKGTTVDIRLPKGRIRRS
ncbi:hypothetical protein HH303_14960 [Rhodospirillaceae bacterium KN72]|uniref:histidine kinase n=1 Tax=Pacificispira spongiicola TaxID=2729598 RepID=A0A7Y0E232_9PROT|nr:PAS domain-containing sensor histidine kinase [Pacificispira spongiicola]NMM45794.1 hypothetical protein [Pacificispira spongiicola]